MIKHFYKVTNPCVKGKTYYDKNGKNKGTRNFVEYTHEITGRVIYRWASHDKKISNFEDVHHGYSNSRIYRIWQGMVSRCHTETDTAYQFYGAKGIYVDDRWLDPEVFIFDMLDTYKDNLTLERIDYKRGYSKDNCKWITIADQAKNKSNNVRITIDGVTKILNDWCIQYNIKPNTAVTRITKYGWNPEKAVTTQTKFMKQWHKI